MKHTLLSTHEFIQRRAAFITQMPENSITLISAAGEVTRSNDTEYVFCQNKSFYYLTGFNEPDAILVLVSGSSSASTEANLKQSILFCRDKNALEEVWQGRRVGATLAKVEYGFDQAWPLSELDEKITELLNNKHQLWFCQGQSEDFDRQVFSWLKQVKQKSRQGFKAPKTFFDCADIINEQRLFKSEAELNIMRQANVLSGKAHQRAMKNTAVGKYEYQIESDILHVFSQHNARQAAYTTIVAGGDNANILHYTANNDALNNNELLLIDAGGELAGYAADITRTFPINGKFTPAQKTLYQCVLDAQNLAIEAIKPGETLAQLNIMVSDFLTTQLHQLGILAGDLNQLILDKACKKYFIHGLGHWLGLDVHDVGDYHTNEKREQRRLFEPGMVMTIEPGLYIPLDDYSVDEMWRGIGIRIEDNIVVTADGYENLTVNSPKTIADIEALMAQGS